MPENEPKLRASRWVSVIFLQGEEADEVLSTIDIRGAAAAVEYLQQWDYGDATTDAALTNGYVYEGIPASSTDRTFEDDGSAYALTYSDQFGYVSLLRQYSVEPESDLVSAPGASAMRAARAHHNAGQWSGVRSRPTTYAGHAVAL